METKIRLLSFDYLRSFIILLVLIHHSVLAYTPFSEVSPLIDKAQWLTFNYVVLFNDSFFMALLFLISGLFVWKSLKNKGIKKFLTGRLLKLGLPFILFTGLTYFYNVSEITGHLWFLWVLLEYTLFIVIIYKFIPNLDKLLIKENVILKNPIFFCLSLIIVSTLAYLPMAIPFGSQERIFFYLIYFIFGVWLGAQEINNTIFKKNSKLIKYWWIWLIIALIIFIIKSFFSPSVNNQNIISILIHPIASATISLSIVAIFLKFIKKHVSLIDDFNNNAYGIYIIHYAIVIYLQYYLLNFNLGAVYKALIVFVLTLLFSWGIIKIIRLIPLVKRII